MKFLCAIACVVLFGGALSACPCGDGCFCGPSCFCATPVAAADCAGALKTKVKQVVPRTVAVRAYGVKVKKSATIVSKQKIRK